MKTLILTLTISFGFSSIGHASPLEVLIAHLVETTEQPERKNNDSSWLTRNSFSPSELRTFRHYVAKATHNEFRIALEKLSEYFLFRRVDVEMSRTAKFRVPKRTITAAHILVEALRAQPEMIPIFVDWAMRTLPSLAEARGLERRDLDLIFVSMREIVKNFEPTQQEIFWQAFYQHWDITLKSEKFLNLNFQIFLEVVFGLRNNVAAGLRTRSSDELQVVLQIEQCRGLLTLQSP